MLSYKTISDAIDECPVTWLPALLLKCAERCAKIGAFNTGKMVESIKRIEDSIFTDIKERDGKNK